MKKLVFTLSLGAVLSYASGILSASAAAIVASSLGSLATQPGSATDYSIFGNTTEPQFPTVANQYGTGSQTSVLDDVTLAAGADTVAPISAFVYAGGTDKYSTITDASSTSQLVGDLGTHESAATDLLDVTLGTPTAPATAASTFDFSNFDVYLLYGNAEGDGNVRDTSFTVNLLSGTTVEATSGVVLVSDTNTDQSLATFEKFHITGATSGETLQIGGENLTADQSDPVIYLGGISFDEGIPATPEPSTWALMLGGLGLLIGVVQLRKRNA